MPEIVTEAFGLHNLPATALLGVMVVYWLMVLLGLADSDMDGGGDGGVADGGHFDAGHADAGGVDAHAEVDAGASSTGGLTVGGHADVHAPSHGGGFWQTCGRLLHLGEIPLMIVLSVLSLFVWFLSVSLNVLFNGEPGSRGATMALLLLIPNLMVSLLLTRVVLTPLRRVIRRMQSTESEVEQVIGREGVVCTGELTDRFGQIEIPARGVPVVVNARTAPGRDPLARGTRVIVYEAGPDHAFYLVRPLE